MILKNSTSKEVKRGERGKNGKTVFFLSLNGGPGLGLEETGIGRDRTGIGTGTETGRPEPGQRFRLGPVPRLGHELKPGLGLIRGQRRVGTTRQVNLIRVYNLWYLESIIYSVIFNYYIFQPGVLSLFSFYLHQFYSALENLTPGNAG